MQTFLTILHVIVSIFMILVILLQAGKGGGMGGALGGGGTAVFGARGAQPFLGKVTTVCAIVFMCTSIGLAYLSSAAGSSVLQGVPPPRQQQAPAAPLDGAPAAPAPAPAPSNTDK